MENDLILLDGAMGTMLQAAGLPVGAPPELWNVTAPEKVAAVHRSYVAAGSRVVCANTFGANRLKLAKTGYDPAQVIAAGIGLARAAVEPDVRVALDVGPIGQLMEPLGTLTFDEAYDIFRQMVTAGRDAGADLIFFETMSDLAELRAGVLAAKENTDLPVWASMTFEPTGRTFLGATVPAMGLTLTGLGVDAMGFNCSLGPAELLPLMAQLRRWTDRPLLLKPNAGLPDPATGAYDLTPALFARQMSGAPEMGVTALGGCCGTTPDFIRALAAALAGKRPAEPAQTALCGVCSPSRVAALDGGVRVVGERINPTGKKRLQQALREGDMGYIQSLAIGQQDAGAEILDINVGLPGIDEPAMMARVVRAVQAVCDLPLQIDSADPAAIEAGLRACVGRAIVNSVNGEAASLDAILPLCKKYGAAVVGLTMDGNGIPPTAEGRAAIAGRILDAALRHGLKKQDVCIDCLTLTVSAQQEQAVQTLRAVAYVRGQMGLQTMLGVSNISFGLPAREHVTASFLTQALYAGLTLPIVDPGNAAVMGAVAAWRVLSGQDRDSAAYIARYAGAARPLAAPPEQDVTLSEAVARGLGEQTAALTRQALERMDELEAVNTLLIPALDEVGERYERGELFLPQLISAANAACAGFEVIRRRIAERGGAAVSRGKILLATVRGDIHDIGKNIVRVVLENYGYTVIDLGRDVPPEAVVEAAVREDVRLVGLSALMTTTVPSMAETIAALRRSGHDCKIMVGGAVLTARYAAQIGADYYAHDAKQSADIAREVLG